mgnify:CR=1 FL=1
MRILISQDDEHNEQVFAFHVTPGDIRQATLVSRYPVDKGPHRETIPALIFWLFEIAYWTGRTDGVGIRQGQGGPQYYFSDVDPREARVPEPEMEEEP